MQAEPSCQLLFLVNSLILAFYLLLYLLLSALHFVLLNSTPFVRQYDILFNKWGVLLCQKEYQTNDIRRNSREWL